MQESEKNLALSDADRQQVNDALEAILATEKFDAAPQMSAFLRYVVEQSIDGLQGRIKAFTVAVDALGKPDTFDPQNDPVVRVLAGRLRAALSAYNNENPDLALKIKMVPGSYVPIFEHRCEATASAVSDTKAHGEKKNNQATATPAFATGQNASTDQNHSSAIANARLDNGQKTRSKEASGTNTHESSAFEFARSLLRLLSTIPTTALAGVLGAGLIAAVLLQKDSENSGEPDMSAAQPTQAVRLANRSKPDHPSVFISSIDEGNTLENSLNALLSGAISENEQVNVYRIMDKDVDIRFWPEEYILSVNALDLPDEVRVNLQLIEAMSGQIVLTREVSLNEDASSQLTHEEMARLTEVAKLMVSDRGPLVSNSVKD